MMNDDQAGLFMLSILVTLVIGAAAITVWHLCRALGRARARSGDYPPQPGFEVIVWQRADNPSR